MAYSPIFTWLARNSQRKHWLFRTSSPKIGLSARIASEFTGYFDAARYFRRNKPQNMAYFAAQPDAPPSTDALKTQKSPPPART